VARLEAVVEQRIEGCRDLVSCERLSGGASQETYRLEIATATGARTLALRRAAGGVDAESSPTHPGIRVEAQLMQCAAAAGVPEPAVHYVLAPEDGLGDGFIMQWLEGEALGARILRDKNLDPIRPRLAYECGSILATIHAIDLEQTGLDQSLSRVTPIEFVEQTWEQYRDLNTPQPMIDFVARWLLDHLPNEFGATLVHNDFRNGNLLIAPRGIVAVLDWELAHIGDPMRDLGWICTNSWRFGRSDLPVGGFGTLQDLYAGYEAVSGRKVDPDHVHFWQVFGSFWWAVGCLRMAEHYRSGPDQTVERPAIGRRSSECQVDCVNMLIPGPVDLIVPSDSSERLDMPTLNELVTSVRDFLRADVMETSQGRVRFLSRVAGNSLDIVLREHAAGPECRSRETSRLRTLLREGGGLSDLRWRLVKALRSGEMALDSPGLAEHLRATVVNQVAIDQPRYSGLETALASK
jgi:aminoglycoside phosphotransferase (APT) family kinase protein